MKKIFLIALLALVFTLTVPQIALAQIANGQQINVKEVAQINEVGDLHLEATYTYAANYYTTAIAPSKLNPFLIPEVRFLRSGQTTKEIPRDSIKVEFDDAKSSIKVSYDAMGFTVNKKDYWELETVPGATLASQSGTVIVLSSTQQDNINTYLYVSTINLPKEASNIKFNSDTGIVKYTLPDDCPGDFPFIWVIIGGVVVLLAAGYFLIRKMAISKAKSA